MTRLWLTCQGRGYRTQLGVSQISLESVSQTGAALSGMGLKVYTCHPPASTLPVAEALPAALTLALLLAHAVAQPALHLIIGSVSQCHPTLVGSVQP